MTDREYVERKCAQLVDAGFWPREQELRYRGWLSNFDDRADLEAAVSLLDHFVFINRDHASLAVLDGYTRFLGHLHDMTYQRLSRTRERLQTLHAQVQFTAVRGESPNLADSGFAYTRIAREEMLVPEERIHELPDAIDRCANGEPVVVVDDFSGTGNQIVNTITSCDRAGRSLLRLVQQSEAVVCCVTAVMTSCAMRRIRRIAPALHLYPGYIAPENEYSIDALLPRDEHPGVHAMLSRQASKLSTGGIDEVRGLNGLGLMLGVHDRIPDASLPIFWADGGDGWIPLKPRRG